MRDALNASLAETAPQTYDLDDWRQVRWVLTAVNWKPSNAIVPGKKGAVVLLLVKAEDDAEAINQACQWSHQCQGQIAGIIETGLCVEGLPVSKRTLNSYDPIAQAAATCEPAFLSPSPTSGRGGDTA